MIVRWKHCLCWTVPHVAEILWRSSASLLAGPHRQRANNCDWRCIPPRLAILRGLGRHNSASESDPAINTRLYLATLKISCSAGPRQAWLLQHATSW